MKFTSDADWYQRLFQARELRLLSPEDVSEVILFSMDTAKKAYQQYEELIAEGGYEAVFAEYSVAIQYVDTNVSSQVLALYDVEQNVLKIFRASIEAFYQHVLGKALEFSVSLEEVYRIVLAHELYHVIEMNENLYTYQKIMPRTFLGFRWRKRLVVASEIGAYHFAKLAENLPYNLMVLEDYID